jgi:chemotaxis protein methyltransferase CheR
MEEYLLTTNEFDQFRKLIHKKVGISLADGKRNLVQSRLRKRLAHYSLPTYQMYYDLLISLPESDDEWTEFINCVTTNKTDFYREAHHFKFVAEQFIPEMLARAKTADGTAKIRVWHAGCSSGEEPYTLAITLQEALRGKGTWDVKQLASDIDTQVLAHAAAGIYDMERVAPIPQALLSRYFLRGTGSNSGSVRAKSVLRDQIAFRQINLLGSPWPFSAKTRFDMIFCRNVVIYFDKPTQRTLFHRFSQLLRPGGYLFLGHSESLLGISDSFDSLGRTIYRLPELGAVRLVA